MLYGTALDFGSVLSALEAAQPLQYTLMGMFKVRSPQSYQSYESIPDFGRATHPTAVANRRYLLASGGTRILMREVSQKLGGVLYSVDQLVNEDTIVLRPGGRFGNDVILCGMIGTVSESTVSKELYRLVVSAFRENFRQEREFLIGPEAHAAWSAGVRLTIGALAPSEFDLKRSRVG